MGRFATALGLALLLFHAGSASAGPEPLDRWAVIIGQNDGGSGRQQLRWAEQDALRMAQVLGQLGRFSPDRIQLLVGQPPQVLRRELARVAAALPADSSGSLLVIFYSGHSDGKHLLLGEERLAVAELKSIATRSKAEVSLIILDACNSGAAVRFKGGRSAPSFLHFGDQHRSRGRIVLASAAAHELAQESDAIGSSVFTHYLVSGLRGEADRSGDGRVTLVELYRYVYDQTVRETVASLPGVQHPSFSYDLKGEGAIVLTDLNTGSSGVLLPAKSRGKYLLFNREHKTVVAEVDKQTEQPRLVPVPPGRYTIKKRERDHLLIADLSVQTDTIQVVHDGDMRVAQFDNPVTKGWDLGISAASRPPAWTLEALAGWTAFSRSPAGGVWGFPSGGLAVRLTDWPADAWRMRLAWAAGAWESEAPVQDGRIPFRLVATDLKLMIAWALSNGPFEAEFGALVGWQYLQRRFDHLGYQDSDQTQAGGAGLSTAAILRFGSVRLGLELSGGLWLYSGADRMTVPFYAGAMTVGWEL